jgi:1-aminocyclopropane-1-carboxylate deaminase/D-cysteine desulfhydrase-like pyridoxal-dependent ACC family enzyme
MPVEAGSRVERLAPGLAGQRAAIGSWPTPLRSLEVGSGLPLLVEDEGEAARAYGGNEVRKLEWLLPRVRPGAHVVTVGAVGSNFVLATAWYGRERGLPVHAVLLDHGWFGDGYGRPTPAGEDAAMRARAAGLPVDATYSAKALAAAVELHRSGDGPVLFVDTANTRPVDRLVDGGQVPEPPASLAHLFTT